jgi:hypothetical protein
MAEDEGRRGEWARRPPNGSGRRADGSLGTQPSLALLLREGGGYLLQARYLSVRCQLIDKFREVLRQLRQKIFLRHASLLRSLADSVLPKRRVQLPGLNRLVLTGPEPGLDGLAVPCVLKHFKETTKTAYQAAF